MSGSATRVRALCASNCLVDGNCHRVEADRFRTRVTSLKAGHDYPQNLAATAIRRCIHVTLMCHGRERWVLTIR